MIDLDHIAALAHAQAIAGRPWQSTYIAALSPDAVLALLALARVGQRVLTPGWLEGVVWAAWRDSNTIGECAVAIRSAAEEVQP